MNLDRVKLYFISFNLYNFSGGLISIFLNLFVLATASLSAVIYFNIFYYSGLELSYFATAYALDHMEPKDLYMIGAVIRAAALVMLIFAAALASNIVAFGLLYGISIGTFWLGNNILTTDVSKGHDRRDFVYRNSQLGSIVGFVAPTIAGILIQYSQFTGPLRFAYDFVAAVIILLASAYTMSIMKLGKTSKPIRFRYRDSVISHKEYVPYKIYYMLWQLFALPFGVILPVYILLITNNYVITGLYASSIVVITILANYLTHISSRYWKRFVKASVYLTIAASILLLIPEFVNPLFSILLFTFTYTLFITPLNNQASINFLELIDESAKDRIYFWINREYYITIGRAIALAAMAIMLAYSPNNVAYLVFLFPFMCLYSVVYFKVAERMEKKKLPKAETMLGVLDPETSGSEPHTL